MKIIVTGGAGFIGGNFVHHMVNKYPVCDGRYRGPRIYFRAV